MSTFRANRRPAGLPMNSQFIDEASKIVPESQILINMVSKRVRQLGAGSRPLVLVEPRMGLADIALVEIAQGKLSVSKSGELISSVE